MSETWRSMDDLPLIPTWRLRVFRAKLLLLIVFGSIVGCSYDIPDHGNGHELPLVSCERASDGDVWCSTQSWDQENLKRDDSGCPTAIYIAPAGKLEECK